MLNSLSQRIAAMDWNELQQSLDEQGYAATPTLLDKNQCKEIISTYDEEANFRSTIDMARYRFGIGDLQILSGSPSGYFATAS